MWLLSNFNSGTQTVNVKPQKVFVVLCGGPGLYDARDPKHDKSWASYVLPFMVSAKAKRLEIDPDETIHWCIYSPAYEDRWADDSKPDAKELARERRLAHVRLGEVNLVKKRGASNYVDHVHKRAAAYTKYDIEVFEFASAAQFWAHLKSLGKSTVTRVWYFGHASDNARAHGLWLSLNHNSSGVAVNPMSSAIVNINDIARHADLADRFVAKPKPSKFFGCNTAQFASEWSSVLSVPSEGADVSVHFAGMWPKSIEESTATFVAATNALNPPQKKKGWVSFSK